MTPISLCDELEIVTRNDHVIAFNTGHHPLQGHANLCERAATALRTHVRRPDLGCDIRLMKHIPIGAGLGGGSSDAATTLLALNQLWTLRLPDRELRTIGGTLGADVPFFIPRQPAQVWGTGTETQPMAPVDTVFLVVMPHIGLSTQEMFNDKRLVHRELPVRVPASADSVAAAIQEGHNGFEDAARQHAEVKRCWEALSRLGRPRLSGSGSALFLSTQRREDAEFWQRTLNNAWPSWICSTC